VGRLPNQLPDDGKQGFYDPRKIAVVDVDGTRCMELQVVSGKNNGSGKPSGATPEARLVGPKQDGYTTGERIQSRMKLYKPGPGGHFLPLGWPRLNSNWHTVSLTTSSSTPEVHPPLVAGSMFRTADRADKARFDFSPT
jgi:hypothetical protein